MEDILAKIYYDPANPSSFTTAEKVWRQAKKFDPSISLNDVQSWLSSQLTYTLHKPARRRFKRNPIVVDGIDDQWEADIVDMQEFSRSNDGHKYILTIIDCFSKFAFAKYLKDKSARSVEAALASIFQQRHPARLRTDRGTEFTNKIVQKLLKNYLIQFFTSKDLSIKCAIVERFNRTLKSRMYKYFTARGTRRYIDVLDQLVDAYNHDFHKSIKMSPIEVNSENSPVVFENLYGATSRIELLKKNAFQKIPLGESVRVKYELKPFDKSFYPNWTDQVFSVDSVNKLGIKPFYLLKSEDGSRVPRRYYEHDLQKIKAGLYRVEKIVGERTYKGIKQFKVKWLGYPESYNSWVNDGDITRL